jgi:hypothetical protein
MDDILKILNEKIEVPPTIILPGKVVLQT